MKADNLARMRELLGVTELTDGNSENSDCDVTAAPTDATAQACPHCGGAMRIIEVFEAGHTPRHHVTLEGIDSS
ncbi:MAG: hypothetical protein ACR2PG_21755 [Hyphomicrobiaceae bacterium]